MPRTNTLADFWAQVTPGPGRCWTWTGTHGETGYGKFSWRGRYVAAHRFSLQASLGRPIAPGFQALHTCDTRDCVRPLHLYEGTIRQNVLDQVIRKRHAMSKRDHCARGHAYTPENTVIQRSRRCVTCLHENQAAARNRGRRAGGPVPGART